MKFQGLNNNRLRIGGFITILCTAVISFTSVQHLTAASFGWSSWLFPVGLDAVAAVCLDVWLKRLDKSWKFACAMTLTAIGLSLAANTTDHWLTSHSVLAAMLGAVPPFMLAGLLIVFHQYAMANELSKKPKVVAASSALPDFKVVHDITPLIEPGDQGRHRQSAQPTVEDMIRGPQFG